MKLVWALSTLVTITVAQLIDGGYNTRLNHFDHLDNRIVHFPYLINLNYYNAGGPLLFYLNDETHTTEWVDRGLMVDIARATNGALITSNLRFFGSSHPTDDASFENLQYLSGDQNVNDVAYFIQEVKRHLASPNARVIVWGSKYGGTLAVWARQNFPFLIDGAWSSSGLFRSAVFSTAFYDQLEDVIVQHSSAECSANLRIAFQEIHNRVVARDSVDLINNFGLCEPWNVSSRMDVGLLFQGLARLIEQNIRRNLLDGFTTLCNNLTAIPNDPYISFGGWVRTDQGTYLNCLDYDFTELLFRLRETYWEAPTVVTGARMLLFIHCTESGWLQTTRPSSMFANHISQYFQYAQCIETFAGTDYQFERLYNANKGRIIKFGSTDPNTSRVIITNGKLDPSIAFGISEYNATDSLLFNFPNYSRSADLDKILPTDSIFLANAKQEIFDKIVGWATGTRN